VSGRCRCYGHASSCNNDDGACICVHNTAGQECERCAASHNAAPWAAGIIPLPAANDPGDAHACVACNCSGRAGQCTFDAGRFGSVGDGSDCSPFCTDNTTGFNCERCLPGFHKHIGSGGASTCVPCRCDARGAVSSNCDAESGACTCKAFVVGTLCDQCERGYRSLAAADPQGCTACDCYQPGTRGLAVDCDEVLGCDCQNEYTGAQCAECIPGYIQVSVPAGGHVCSACDPECSRGCTAVGDDACTVCRNDRVVNGSDTRCVPSCSDLQRANRDTYFVSATNVTECGVCDSECAGGCTDTGPQACTRCNTVLYAGTCQSVCPPFTFTTRITGSAECLTCHSQCGVGCTGPTANDCQECANAVAMNGTCVATCGAVEFSEAPTNGSGVPQCRPCDDLCDGCSGARPSDCHVCRADAHLWRDVAPAIATCVGACNTSISYAATNTVTGAAECLPCSLECVDGCNGPTVYNCSAAGCVNWEQAGACVAQCGPGFIQHPSSQMCVTACPLGSFSDGRQCLACSQTCATCTAPAVCELCIVGHVLSLGSPGQCVDECEPNEYVTTVNTTLSSGTLAVVHECRTCDAECHNCSDAGPDRCAMCRHVVLNGVCLAQCPLLQYASVFNRCEPCSQQCASGCSGPLPIQCIEVTPGDNVCNGFSQNGECVSACANSWFNLANSTTCGRCHPTCRTCSTSNVDGCTTCTSTRFLAADNQCMPCDAECGGSGSCTGGDTGDSGSGGAPVVCVDGCRNMQAVDTFGDISCVTQCAADYVAVNATTCLQCHSECSGGCTGVGPEQCAACQTTSHLGLCVTNCPANLTRTASGICVQCHRECVGGCSGPSASQCVSCASMAFNGDCVSQCPSTTFQVPGQLECQPCNLHCGIAGCIGDLATECRSCATARYNGACITACPSNTTVNAVTTDCIPCHAECRGGCSGPSALNCNFCRTLRFGALCTSVCPAGYYADQSTLFCTRCDPECTSCTAAGPSACDSCLHFVDTTLTGSTECVDVCAAARFLINSTVCVSVCPSSQPFYSDTRVTETRSACGVSCDALNDPRLQVISPDDEFKCTTPELADSDNRARVSSGNTASIPPVAIGVAAFLVLAALAAVALAIEQRRTKRDGSASITGGDGAPPAPMSPELAEAVRVTRSGIQSPMYYTPNLTFSSSPMVSHISPSGESPYYLDVAPLEHNPTDLEEDGTASTSL
jgi:hypothetical protein